VCRIAVTVSSRSLSTSEAVDVAVFSAPVDGGPGEGSAVVNGEYIARPIIGGFDIWGAGSSMYVYRSSPNAMLSNFQPGATYSITLRVDYGTRSGTFTNALEFDCGGTLTSPSYDACTSGGFCSVNYSWVAPSIPTVCKLTGRAANSGLTDSFSVGFSVR
jgi:hypothetical protein